MQIIRRRTARPWLSSVCARRGAGAALAAALVAVLAAAAAAAAADRYVALGDSYSSGVGTRTYYDSTCKRSVYAYPYLVSQDRPNTSLVFAACSGAKTTDVLSSQVSSLTSTTRWVTITIGGNDAGFSDVVTECAKPAWMSNCAGRVSTAQSYIRNTLPGQLDPVYSQIASRAPSATVIVLGYPRLFMGEDCNAATWFSPDDESRLNATADLLASTTKARAQTHGFVFKDAIPPFIGHAVCDNPEWLNGLSNPTTESYHPNTSGQRLGYEPLVRSVMG
jgi:lysophospholipase L1-like esterase